MNEKQEFMNFKINVIFGLVLFCLVGLMIEYGCRGAIQDNIEKRADDILRFEDSKYNEISIEFQNTEALQKSYYNLKNSIMPSCFKGESRK